MSSEKTDIKQILLCLNETSVNRCNIEYKYITEYRYNKNKHKIDVYCRVIVFYTKYPIWSHYFNYDRDVIVFLLAEMERFEKKKPVCFLNEDTKKVEYIKNLDIV